MIARASAVDIAVVRPPLWKIMAVWMAFGWTDAMQALARERARGSHVDYFDTILGPMPAYVVLALLTPPIFVLCQRAAFDGAGRVRAVAVHGAASLVFPALHLALSALATTALYRVLGRGDLPAVPLIAQWMGVYYAADVVRYWGVVGIFHALLNRHRARQSELAMAQMQREVAAERADASEARLQQLSAQLAPHFLFNTLNVIGGLAAAGEGARASQLVLELSRVLRASLVPRGPVQPLAQEMCLVRDYLNIERARIGDRLVVVETLDDKCGEVEIPAFMIQVLVENAVRHGIGRVPGPGQISMTGRCGDTHMVLEVLDTGPGFGDAAETPGNGIGLSNLRERLRVLYGERGALSTGNGPQGGALVTVSVPLDNLRLRGR